MNYQRIYNELITNAQSRHVPTGYTEKHHIVPRSMGGTDDIGNLVRLTGREHYVAHHLLYKIHKNSSMAHAWFLMCNGMHGGRYKVTSVQYTNARKAHSTAAKDYRHSPENIEKIRKASTGRKMPEGCSVGSNNSFHGKSHTEETKRKISEAKTGIKLSPRSSETKRKISLANKGRKLGPRTDKAKKQGAANLSKHWAKVKAYAEEHGISAIEARHILKHNKE